MSSARTLFIPLLVAPQSREDGDGSPADGTHGCRARGVRRRMTTPLTRPGFEQTVSPEQAAAVADAARRCAIACRTCADACLGEHDVTAMVECIRTDVVCADVCDLVARTFTRSSDVAEDVAIALLNSCVLACQACATECELHDHDHCRTCAEACRACEAACKQLLRSLADLPADE